MQHTNNFWNAENRTKMLTDWKVVRILVDTSGIRLVYGKNEGSI